MITIIHGDDIVSSRQALSKLKEERESLELPAKVLNLETLKQEFEGGGLFGQDKIIIIENLLASENKEALFYLRENDLPYDLVLWEEKEIGSRVLATFPKAKILHFKLKRIIFSFLDSLVLRDKKTLIRLFHETLKTTEPEIVFYMLVRHFRLMLGLGDKEKIDELKRLQAWQLEKLKKQANLLGREKLILLYKRLFEIEKAQKTGGSALALAPTLDLFLLEI